MAEKQTKQPDNLEEDDSFEEFADQCTCQGHAAAAATAREAHSIPTRPFCCAGPTQAAAEDDNQDLWQADWDDEDVGEDFQTKLKRELNSSMQE
jgi:hypothetical protein